MEEVKTVIHEQIIKPSSPTPHALRTFKLSLLDQMAPTIYTPLVLFYSSNVDPIEKISVDKKLAHLKDSLAKALTHFYPLAGRIKDCATIDCNDDGALYMEANVSCSLLSFLDPVPQMELLDKLLPCQSICNVPIEMAPQIAIKANIFTCGGIAFGICLLHKLIDGFTLRVFLKLWAEINHASWNGDRTRVDNVAGTKLFPPVNADLPGPSRTSGLVRLGGGQEKTIMRRFLFDAKAISTLNSNASSELVLNPSPAEVITSLIWKCAMNGEGIHGKPSVLVYMVDLRTRLNTILSEFSIGNILLGAFSESDMADRRSLDYLVSLMRKSVEEMNPKFLESLQGQQGARGIFEHYSNRKVFSNSIKPSAYAAASLTKIGVYQVDFGWGRPLWVALGPTLQTALENTILLLDTKSGDGIEAWIILNEHEMEKLENNLEFQAYATPNPAIKP